MEPNIAVAEKETLYGMGFSDIAEFYHASLVSKSESREILENLGINPELVHDFQLGISDGSLKEKLSESQHAIYEKLGILNEGKEVLENSVVIPLRNTQGIVEGLCGISLQDQNEITISGNEPVFFNQKVFSTCQELIVTRHFHEALLFLSLGITNVTAICTKDHLFQALEEYRIKTVILTGNDNAFREEILSRGIPVKELFFEPSLKEKITEGLTKRSIKDRIKKIVPKTPQLETNENTVQVEKDGVSYRFRIGEISYRIVGVKELFISSLKVNIQAKIGEAQFRDYVDLFAARSRTTFSNHAASDLGISSGKIEKDLISILEYLEDERDRQLAPGHHEKVKLTNEEIALGMGFLTDPAMFDRIVKDSETLGYVGEEVNKKLLYVASSSRKLDDPISVMVLSESASGKSYLIDTVRKLMPVEDVVSVTSLSDQALNYLPEDGLLHKFLVLGEAVHGEKVEYQLREMISSHELSRLITVNDSSSGEMISKIIRKKVIVSIAMSGTNFELNQENASRSFVINTDESMEQTKAIHEKQRKKYSFDAVERKKNEIPLILKTHHAAQRLLEKRVIINPFAQHLDFPAQLMRSRRDHERFIDLIACVCFLRQFQKKTKQKDDIQYIECDLTDYEIAYEIITGILPATVSTFPKSAGQLYEVARSLIHHKAEKDGVNPMEVTITQRELREYSGLSQMSIKRNVKALVDYEYLIVEGTVHRGMRKHYRLLADKDLHSLDVSMVPSPTDIKEKINSNPS